MPSAQRDFAPEVLLERPLMADLATVTQDARPCSSPVWFLWEEGCFWSIGDTGSSFIKRLMSNPACAVTITDFDAAGGVLLHLGLRGQADVVAMDPARFRRLLARYLGPDEPSWNPWFIDTVARIDDPEGRMIRLRPENVVTKNVSFFRTGPDIIGT